MTALSPHRDDFDTSAVDTFGEDLIIEYENFIMIKCVSFCCMNSFFETP